MTELAAGAATDRALGAGLRRRPAGEPPPLPRQFDRATLRWLVFFAGFAAALLALGLFPGLAGEIAEREGTILASISRNRSAGTAERVASIYDVLFVWLVPVVGWATLVTLFVVRRFRHALLFFVGLILVAAASSLLAEATERPRPYEVVLAGRWEGFAFPSRPVAMAAAVLVGAYLALVPPGRWRRTAQLGVAVFLLAYCIAETYLTLSYPIDDQSVAIVLGATIPIVLFRAFAPEEIFPVRYGRAGNAAHLDLGGARGDAIRSAIETQLDLRVLDVTPIGDEGSAGSTPMILTVADPENGEPRGKVFAKLLASSHLRSDRWYKLFRTLRYGRLEDEYRFTTVRRLVQQEDYLGLRMAAAGVAVPRTYGIVEMTPEREYLLVTDFLDGYEEIGKADIDDAVIDGGLRLVRTMWDRGLAHRDVKPANLMVHGDDISFIDVGFSQVRPSPWRQAVDLANMMLVLALRSDSATVYQRARRYFSDDDIAEAFAATQGMTVPAQLKREIRNDGRDLIGEFKAMAPARPPIKIQRWSLRRVLLLVGVILGALALALFTLANLSATGLFP